ADRCRALRRLLAGPGAVPAAPGRGRPAVTALATGLALAHVGLAQLQAVLAQQLAQARQARFDRLADLDICAVEFGADLFAVELHAHLDQIGRASCRERV